MQDKTLLRIRFKEERKNINLSEVSKTIVEKIRKSDFYKNAKNVMLFYPLKYEINLLTLLEDNKNFYFPKVSNQDLYVCPYDKEKGFIKSEMNINEPCTSPVDKGIPDLIFVPALAVDKYNYRLGYGGGFYDRFLKDSKALTVVPICKNFLTDNLPHEEFDVTVDKIITNG